MCGWVSYCLERSAFPAPALEPIDRVRLLLYWPHSIRPHYRGEPVCELKNLP